MSTTISQVTHPEVLASPDAIYTNDFVVFYVNGNDAVNAYFDTAVWVLEGAEMGLPIYDFPTPPTLPLTTVLPLINLIPTEEWQIEAATSPGCLAMYTPHTAAQFSVALYEHLAAIDPDVVLKTEYAAAAEVAQIWRRFAHGRVQQADLIDCGLPLNQDWVAEMADEDIADIAATLPAVLAAAPAISLAEFKNDFFMQTNN